LLSKDPKTRIGVQNKEEIKFHEFFTDVDWDKLYLKKIIPPIDLIELKNELNSDSSIMVKYFIYFLHKFFICRLKNHKNFMILIMMKKIQTIIE